MRTREEHMDWCKRRALEYADAGDPAEAYSSMVSDIGKHPETAGHSAIQLGAMLLFGGQLNTPKAMRDFIEGFN